MTRRTTRHTAVGGALLLLASATLTSTVVAVSAQPAPAAPGAPASHHGAAPVLPTGFSDKVAIGGLSEPTSVAFAPDGTAFIALKTGVIKSFDYDASTGRFEPFGQETDFANLSTNVHNYWDRGLTGIAVDPQFPTRPYVYVNYTYNRDPRDNPPQVPKWFTDPSQQYDDCPQPAQSPNTTGCLTMVRISRLTATHGPQGWVMSGPEQQLVADACFQFPSHASGGVTIGPDGMLYASAGDGASFDFEDYGQVNNPCPGDPVNEGGSLRSQDPQTTADPLGIGGSIIRIDPDTGNAYDGSTANQKRVVAYGQRNPWRLAFRPGTTELWSADVGASKWEEINRATMPSSPSAPTTAVDRGWPCYEGGDADPGAPFVSQSLKQPAWDLLDKPICENLYASGASAVSAPYFSYLTRGPVLTPGEDCQSSTSSISGVSFSPPLSSYPAAYRGSLFFSDYARACVWMLGKQANGDPDPANIVPFVQDASTPVDLVAGPGGDLFYVDYGLDASGVPDPGAGGIHRILYLDPTPVAVIGADRVSGPQSAPYTFTSAGSADPNGRPLTVTWDLDGDGQYDDATGPTATRTYSNPVNVLVGVKVANDLGQFGTASLMIYPGNDPPRVTALSPASGLRWRVGQRIPFAASATDAQDGALAAPAFNWAVSIRHCPDVCHTHPLEQFPAVTSGSFRTPDHEYPSHLLLTLTVTDSRGMPVRQTIRLNPRHVKAIFATSPSRLQLVAAGIPGRSPLTKKFIVGSRFIASVPKIQRRHGVTYKFRSWSDHGALSHEIVARKHKRTYTATYAVRSVTFRVSTSPGHLRIGVNRRSRPSGWRDKLKPGASVLVAAPQVQIRKGVRYEFLRWSDGGRRVHQVRIGIKRVQLRAVYRRA